MNIQYVRLDERVCEPLNQLAMDQRRTVSDLVNDILERYLKALGNTEQALRAE